MSIEDPVIESRLTEAANRWKNLRFVEQAATLGSAILAAWLLLGLANVFAGLPSAVVVTALGLGVVVGFVAVFFMALILAVSSRERSRLADAWERAYAPLLDRLNTLVHLESQPGGPWTRSYARRIEAQTHEVLASEWLPTPFPASRPLRRVLVFLVLLLSTYAFYLHYQPWRGPEVPPTMPPLAAVPEPALELPPPTAVEEETAWGEVRITQPGADLAVTPAEDVPVQIEAASNRPLKSVEWFTAVNDEPEKAHALPDPEEPLFAAYKEAIRPGKLGLGDWDVVTYYARATTKEGGSFRSDVYFVEVRPFRQDILQETGGEASVPYELLDELTGLIEQQQDVIRRTHRGQTAEDGKGSLPGPERDDLARAEDALAKAAGHLAAKFDAALKDRGVDEPSRKLGEAKTALGQAAGKLRDDELNDAKGRQRDALARLVAARKRFQSALDRNPDAFAPLKDEKRAQAPAPADMLEKIAEFRDESQAAQDFVRKTLEEQRKLAQSARALKTASPRLASLQESLRKSLEEFRDRHPKPFEETGKPCDSACQAMQAAADAMKKGPTRQPGVRSEQAAATLGALADALKSAARDRRLADAYRLKQELDAQIDRLRAAENHPEGLVPADQKAAAERAKDLARELKRVAETPPTRDDFGPELGKALDDRAMSELDSRCEGLGKAGGSGPKSKAAKGVREGLEAIARAFEKDAPAALAAGRKGADPLKPGGQAALDRGLAQLESLAEGKAEGGKPGPAQEAKLRAEAVDNLRAGILGRFGHNERSTALVLMLDREVRDRREPIDVKVIDRLRRALEERQIELGGGADATDPGKAKTTRVDPARLPPAYRKAIETYYQRLSERP